jgi:hypothetical protein
VDALKAYDLARIRVADFTREHRALRRAHLIVNF